VSEFVARADIAGGIDPGVAGAQPVIHGYALGRILHLRRFQA
jgi:hypothetical protein